MSRDKWSCGFPQAISSPQDSRIPFEVTFGEESSP